MYLHKLTPSSASSSRLGQAPERDSMSLQSCIECLDRLHDKIDRVYKEMLELRTRITELASWQSGVAVVDSGTWNSSGDLQTFVDDEHNAIPPLLTPPDLSRLPEPLGCYGQPSDLEYGPLEYLGVNITLPEGVDSLVDQLHQDLLLRGTSGFASNEPGVQPFQPQYSTSSEGQTLSDSSVRRDQKLPLPTVQGRQEKVRCTQPGCSRVVRKDGLTRHVNQTHLRKVKSVCASCGKGFTRRYMERDHICRAERRSS
ncbi:hypothetical protein DFH29DRAFT_585166 [Suillus ampliporus]|nr:hypothetical protein DFH29DRAFT_585166 [Suillus ampliporus]